MANMLQRGAAWLGSQLQAHAGRCISLTQGTTTIEGLVVSVAKHEHDAIDREGFITKVSTFDWTIVAADINGMELRPGAVITETLCGVTKRYEAMAIGSNKPCVEPKDSSGILLVLHTTQVT
jgi:hypothetical protein